MKIIKNKKTEYVVKYCKVCNEELIKPYNVSINTYNKRQTCSKKCEGILNTLNNTQIIHCSNCNIEFRRKNFSIIKNENNFCSNTCLKEYKAKQISTISVVCNNCGVTFDKEKGQFYTKKNFCSRKCMGQWQTNNWTGDKHPAYKGEIDYDLYHSIRGCNYYIEWRNSVFERDNYKCMMCESPTNYKLNAHHIKLFSLILKENNIDSLVKSYSCLDLWDINNGITVCEKCHKKLHKKGYSNGNNKGTV